MLSTTSLYTSIYVVNLIFLLVSTTQSLRPQLSLFAALISLSSMAGLPVLAGFIPKLFLFYDISTKIQSGWLIITFFNFLGFFLYYNFAQNLFLRNHTHRRSMSCQPHIVYYISLSILGLFCTHVFL